ncbi:MAG: hypothetical protein Q7J78_05450, partial [Clostridiales bacterium]|nr:hypothetical protein [Clostridiales bacterium]
DFGTVFLGEDIDFAGIQYWALYARCEHNEQPPDEKCFKIGRTWVSTDQEIEMHSPWGPWEDTSIVGLQDRIPDLRGNTGYKMNSVFFREGKASSCRMIVYQSPTWAQFPVDAALGLVDSVNLCDNYYSVTSNTQGPWEFPRFLKNDLLQKEPYGVALWIYHNYYRMLNTGIKLPVSGGSAYPGGGGGGPAGMNRFYVEIGDTFSPDNYFTNWKCGKTFATNGPFLIAEVNGVRANKNDIDNKKDKTQLFLRVVSNRPVKYLEWVADGNIIDRKELTNLNTPQNEVWETEHDLRPYHWIAARCFGESERTLFPKGGHISPPFLTAHTSPVYLKCFGKADSVKLEAVNNIIKHIDWMKEVIEGTRDSAFASGMFDFKLLNDNAKIDIFNILNKARKKYISGIT